MYRFDGRVVAKLPFEPFGFVSGITHRNIPGNNMQECSFLFIYILSSLFFRNNIMKLAGVEQQQQNPFGDWATPKTE